MGPELTKKAALAIRQLKGEVGTLRQKKDEVVTAYDMLKLAMDTAMQLFEEGHVAAEDLSEAVADFKTKTKEELEVVKKAAEMSRQRGNPLLFGSLSEEPQYDEMDAAERFINAIANFDE